MFTTLVYMVGSENYLQIVTIEEQSLKSKYKLDKMF